MHVSSYRFKLLRPTLETLRSLRRSCQKLREQAILAIFKNMRKMEMYSRLKQIVCMPRNSKIFEVLILTLKAFVSFVLLYSFCLRLLPSNCVPSVDFYNFFFPSLTSNQTFFVATKLGVSALLNMLMYCQPYYFDVMKSSTLTDELSFLRWKLRLYRNVKVQEIQAILTIMKKKR